jgi:3,4-dihydroxy 2-butanone 4-phosphate synthase/GTP cyclohydrolase II
MDCNFGSINDYYMLDRIEDAIEDIRNGRMVIVVDDEDRENEGDFIAAAEHTTAEVINFMSKEGRGLICIALTEERCAQLGTGANGHIQYLAA